MKFNTQTRFRSAICSSLFGLALTGVCTPAHAQSSSGQETYVEDLKACQALTEDAARLRCYDQAVGRVVTASDEGEVRILNNADVQKTQRGLFGFTLPKIDLFSSGKNGGEPLETLQSVITNVSISGRNTVFLTIEEGGAVWRIPSADSRTMRAQPGDTVEFKKAALGSYFIRIDGRSGVKGRRVE